MAEGQRNDLVAAGYWDLDVDLLEGPVGVLLEGQAEAPGLLGCCLDEALQIFH